MFRCRHSTEIYMTGIINNPQVPYKDISEEVSWRRMISNATWVRHGSK